MLPKEERGPLKRKFGPSGSTSKRTKLSTGKATAVQQPKDKAALKERHRPSPAMPVSAKIAKQREKKIGLQEATAKWEKLRRHDTSEEERAELVAHVLNQVKGRVGDVATSPTGSRVLQACAKHGTPAELASLQASIMPRIVELSKSPYGHFLVTKLISSAPQKQLESILKAIRGHVAILLRHPAGAAVIDELYHRASAQQRNLLAAEFYGKEYALLSQVSPPRLAELLATVDGQKRRTILQRMAVHLTPILEKGLIDPVLVHRLVAEYVEAAAPGARTDALQALAGDAMLRMVHTRDGAWLAAALLCYGTAKDCKKAVKSMKGHVETMAKDAWGSLVLCAALSHVDDTVLLRKVILSPLLAKLEELSQDKHARLVFMQLLAPDKPRYLPAHLLGVVNPTISGPNARPAPYVPEAGGERPENVEAEVEASRVEIPSAEAAGVRKKASGVRRAELLGQGPTSLAGSLLRLCTSKTAAMLCSPTGSDIVVELATGSLTGVVQEHHAQAVEDLQRAITAEAQKPLHTGEHVAKTVFGSRALRRLVLASGGKDDQNDTPAQMRDALWMTFKDRLKECEGSHAQKVVEAFRARGLMTG